MANLTELDAFGNTITGTVDADNIDTSGGNIDFGITADSGDDIIVTGNGDGDDSNGGHTVQGGAGNDTITGGDSPDVLRGGTFSSTDPDGNDTIYGGNGDDNIEGGNGSDTLNGDAGNDLIRGDAGDDIINGGAGRDFIYGGAGNDTIDGGTNPVNENDVLFFNHSINDIESINYNAGTITVVGPEGTDTATNIEQISFSDNPIFFDATSLQTLGLGSASADVLTGGVDNDYLIGGAGDDTINGGLGTDSIVAGKGNDTIDAGGNDDGILSGKGNNTIDGGDGNDLVGYNFSRDQISSITRDFNGVITLTHANGQDILTNIEAFDFFSSDADGNRQKDSQGQLIVETVGINDFTTTFTGIDDETINGTTGDDVLNGGAGNDVITGGNGNDTIDGGDDSDTAVFGFASSAISQLTQNNGTLTINGPEGTDTLTNVEFLQFSDVTVSGTSTVIGSANSESLNGSSLNDAIYTFGGIDSVNSGDGDDVVLNVSAGASVNGGNGTDTVVLDFASSDVTAAIRQVDSTVTIKTAQGDTTLNSIEQLVFSDSSSAVSTDSIITETLGPTFTTIDANGNSTQVSPTVYSGAVAFLQYELLGSSDGDVVIGSDFNDFMNLSGGNDAANGGAGQDVLDGGTGSNFLTGGDGNDTFFLDGRGGTTTWSTITDFNGDNVNIWGWNEGTSRLHSTDASNGADGFKGATFHYDLDNNGVIDTSITFSGLTLDQVPDSSAQIVADNGYLLFA